MTRFAIIIPFRPIAESVNWEGECTLLRKSIESILQQTYAHFYIIVVHTEEPLYKINDPRVEYHALPYGYQAYEMIPNTEDLLRRFKSQKMVVRRWDKARKLCYASKIAKEKNCHYIMAMDADDRISNQLLGWLAANSDRNYCDGWYVDKGYIHKDGTDYMIRFPQNMQQYNGSTHILRADLVTIPDFHSIDWLDYSLFTDHGWIKDRVKEQFGAVLEPIPFYSLVYLVHESNISQILQKAYGSNLKAVIKRLLRSVKLSVDLRNEFGLS
ncbi:MAG: glycosyltransferase [Chitinophagaceae bacterium]|nr:glycosyltransferase [Chitinophagaceae bacterium]